MDEFRVGEYIVRAVGDWFEIGRIKRLLPTGAVVAYSERNGVGWYTEYKDMHKIGNAYCIEKTTLGGGHFDDGRDEGTLYQML